MNDGRFLIWGHSGFLYDVPEDKRISDASLSV